MPSESLTTFSVIPVTTCGDERRNVMDGTELEFVRMEEGSFGTSPSSSSSSSLSLPQSLEATLQIHSEDEEIQPPVLVRVEAPATLAEGYVFGATTTTTTSDDTNGTHSYESSLSSSNQSTRVPVRVVGLHFCFAICSTRFFFDWLCVFLMEFPRFNYF